VDEAAVGHGGGLVVSSVVAVGQGGSTSSPLPDPWRDEVDPWRGAAGVVRWCGEPPARRGGSMAGRGPTRRGAANTEAGDARRGLARGRVRPAWCVRARSIWRDELGKSTARSSQHGGGGARRGLAGGLWVGDFAFPVRKKFWVKDLFPVLDLNQQMQLVFG
jgi:hypothetical protein